MAKRQEQINAAAERLNSLLEDFLAKLPPEERARRHKDAIEYAAKALKSPRARAYKALRTPASRPLSRGGAKTPRSRAYPS